MSTGDLSNKRSPITDPSRSRSPEHSGAKGPLQWVLDLFSSVWLGVTLLSLLFVYCAVGSVGVWLPGTIGLWIANHNWIHEIYWFIPWTQVHIRQAPGLEMTEFEWFHWWPFNLLIALICVNLVVATLRRIPFNVVNLGVWMIHTGIIILAIGSVTYFATKLEGDAPIIRRQVVVHVPGYEPLTLPTQPGTSGRIETDRGLFRFEIIDIDPDWEILSGEDRGKRAYAVSLAASTPDHQFVRQLLVGYPQYTEDTIWTNDPDQPMQRAINAIGRRLVDEEIEVDLAYFEQDWFYLMDSTALYLREKGEREWVQRPFRGLPRYNDYVADTRDVWTAEGTRQRDPDPLEIEVPAHEAGDPLADTEITVTHYLRYAFLERRRRAGGDEIDPAVAIRLEDDRGAREDYQLVANDPERKLVAGGRLQFKWIDSNDEVEDLLQARDARLTFRIPGADVEFEAPARVMRSENEQFTEIEGTDYAFRVETLEDDLVLAPGREFSIAIVQIRTPERTFRRWVFDSTTERDRDFPMEGGGGMHERELPFDDGIEVDYAPAGRVVPLTLLAGPDEWDLRILVRLPGQEPRLDRLQPQQPYHIPPNITMHVTAYAPRSYDERKPFIVPPRQRQAEDRQRQSLIKVELPMGGETARFWLPYHMYAFRDRTEVLRRFPYRPEQVELPDGRVIEVLFARERRPLPATVVLEDFRLRTHIGGFTGSTSSIRDWMSVVRFREEGGWSETQQISMNRPGAYGGFWYFQSQWDPPDEARDRADVPSRGLNYTVLGVGNRNGVWTQLFGCTLSVIGMIYAFWAKPIIKRRRQQAVYERVARESAGGANFAADADLGANHDDDELPTTAEERP